MRAKKRSAGERIPIYLDIIWLLIACTVVLITLLIIQGGIVRRALPDSVLQEENAPKDSSFVPEEAEHLGMPVPDEIRCSVSRVTMPNENIPGFLVSVTWQPVEKAEIYEVYIVQKEGVVVLPHTFQTTECFYETGTANEAEFTFYVRSVSAGETYSPWSEPVHAKTF